MNWIESFTAFAKRLLQLQGRVEQNTEEIAALRKDLKELTEFTRRVAQAVQRNRDRQESDHKILILKLENELLKLENRLSSSSRFIQMETAQEPKQLAETNGKAEGT